MTFLIARAYSPAERSPFTSSHIFSIVASDKSVRYVFADQKRETKWGKRTEQLVKTLRIDRPSTAQEWLNVATRNMGTTEFILLESEDSIGSLSEAVKNERKSLNDSLEKRQTKSSKFNKADETAAREGSKLDELLYENPDLHPFLGGEDVEDFPQAYKEYVKFLVEQAGTKDLNPWLDPWLAGETENLDFSNGLVLYRDMPSIQTTTKEEKTNG
jgi:hypothetical protein